jgi:hypothetical protein
MRRDRFNAGGIEQKNMIVTPLLWIRKAANKAKHKNEKTSIP